MKNIGAGIAVAATYAFSAFLIIEQMGLLAISFSYLSAFFTWKLVTKSD